MRPEPPHQMAGDGSVGRRPQGTDNDDTGVCVCEEERRINNKREKMSMSFIVEIGILV